MRLVETGKDEILIELGIQWDGNPSIILAVEPVMGVDRRRELAFEWFPIKRWKPKLRERLACSDDERGASEFVDVAVIIWVSAFLR